jgi:ABC-2 type transport system permease protein
VDRLIALVGLRWRLELRAMRWAPERLVGLLIALPMLLLVSAFASAAIFFGVRSLARSDPELLLPLASLAATMVGLFWLFSPLLTGVALSETHDVTRLLHFPVPARTLVASSLLANLVQPAVLAKMPIVLGVAIGASARPAAWPAALAGVALSFAFILAVDQVATVVLHGLFRNRRARDIGLFVGLAFGFVLSLLPVLFFAAGLPRLGALRRLLLERDVFAFSPFAWGVRAAVHAGRGEGAAFLAYASAAAAALALCMGVAAILVRRIHRGELDLGGPGAGVAGRPARMVLPGSIGALLEKDLRVAWRDPALKATVFMSMAGPLLFLFFLFQSRGARGFGGGLLVIAAVVGASSFGGNAFGLERRGIALLMSLPVERWRLLAAKNAGALILRLPGLLVLVAAALLAAPMFLPAALTAALCSALLAAGVDNYFSILFPVSVPEPGKSLGAGGGRRGFGAAALGALLFTGTLLLASPFVFLAWLPVLLHQPALWLVSLPLAVAGAAAIYGMLVAGAAGLLERREPEVLERMLASAGDA